MPNANTPSTETDGSTPDAIEQLSRAIGQLGNAVSSEQRITAAAGALRGTIEPQIDVGAYAYSLFCRKYREFTELGRLLGVEQVEAQLRVFRPVSAWILQDLHEVLASRTLDADAAAAYIFRMMSTTG